MYLGDVSKFDVNTPTKCAFILISDIILSLNVLQDTPFETSCFMVWTGGTTSISQLFIELERGGAFSSMSSLLLISWLFNANFGKAVVFSFFFLSFLAFADRSLACCFSSFLRLFNCCQFKVKRLYLISMHILYFIFIEYLVQTILFYSGLYLNEIQRRVR